MINFLFVVGGGGGGVCLCVCGGGGNAVDGGFILLFFLLLFLLQVDLFIVGEREDDRCTSRDTPKVKQRKRRE